MGPITVLRGLKPFRRIADRRKALLCLAQVVLGSFQKQGAALLQTDAFPPVPGRFDSRARLGQLTIAPGRRSGRRSRGGSRGTARGTRDWLGRGGSRGRGTKGRRWPSRLRLGGQRRRNWPVGQSLRRDASETSRRRAGSPGLLGSRRPARLLDATSWAEGRAPMAIATGTTEEQGGGWPTLRGWASLRLALGLGFGSLLGACGKGTAARWLGSPYRS